VTGDLKPLLPLNQTKAFYLDNKEAEMPDNNYNYGAAYIMNSDKVSVDTDEGASKLYREKPEFDTAVQNLGGLAEAMPKKQTKPTVEASFNTMADDRNYFS
jgi:hypothetical protein